MAAGANDKFTKSYSFLQKSLGATITDSATSLTLNNYTNVPTDTKVHFIIDRIDSNGNRTNSARELCSGISNGSGVSSVTRGLHGTTAQTHNAGAVVEFVLSGAAWNDLIDGLLVAHDQDGTLKDNAVVTANITDANVTTAKLADASVTNAKIAATTIDATKFSTANYEYRRATPSSTVDISGSTPTPTAALSDLNVPSWATKAVVHVSFDGYVITGVSDATWRVKIGSDVSTTERCCHSSYPLSTLFFPSGVVEVTLTSTGTQTLDVEVARTAGTGTIRFVTSSIFRVKVEYY